MKKTLLCCALSAVLSPAFAAEPTVKTVVEGLNNPTGLAVRPESGELYVCESGARRIVTVKEGSVTPVITGFPLDSYGKGPSFDIGPLGLVFVSRDMLAVGDGGSLDGEEYLRIYQLVPPGGANVAPVTVYDSKYKLGPIEAGKATGRGEGNFYGLAADAGGIYISANGDDTKGWMLKAPPEKGVPGKLAPFIATKEKVQVDAPVAVAISPKGDLIVGQMGEVGAAPDSLLCVYNAKDGALKGKAELEDVFDVTGFAYSKSGKLYGVDFNWPGKTLGSLFRVDIAADGSATVEKLAELDKPTALAFGPDGALYVTVLTQTEAGKPNGKLLKITGEF